MSTEEQLRMQAGLLDLAYDAIFLRDLRGMVVYWNRGAERTYGWPQDDALHHISHDLLRTEFPQPRQEIEALVLRHGDWEGELRQRRRDGTHVVIASRWVLQRDPDGHPQAILEVNRKITARSPFEAMYAFVEHACILARTTFRGCTRVPWMRVGTFSHCERMGLNSRQMSAGVFSKPSAVC